MTQLAVWITFRLRTGPQEVTLPVLSALYFCVKILKSFCLHSLDINSLFRGCASCHTEQLLVHVVPSPCNPCVPMLSGLHPSQPGSITFVPHVPGCEQQLLLPTLCTSDEIQLVSFSLVMNKPGGAKSSPDMNLTIHYLDAAPDRSGLASGEIVACEEEWSAGAKIQNDLRERGMNQRKCRTMTPVKMIQIVNIFW